MGASGVSAHVAEIYRLLYLVRRVEETIADIYPTDRIKSPVHLSIGQEAVAVGVCSSLGPGDIVFGSYRSHAGYLAKGGSLPAMMAELYGKSTGCTKGRGGSMHLADASVGVMPASAVVGSTIANAAGYAFALRGRASNAVVVSFFGDGATEEGVFAETLNFAALKHLPILFVCENNGYAIHTHVSRRQATRRLVERVRTYGITASRIEDGDVLRIATRTRSYVQAMRRGGGPRFLECATYRLREHVGPGEDWHLGYRSPEEALPWIQNDQVARVGEMLEVSQKRDLEAGVEREIRAAVSYAEESPFPVAGDLQNDVFA
jgi:TPP-dependent pyruvate/acetoin dehydrogenase alpha subunit